MMRCSRSDPQCDPNPPEALRAGGHSRGQSGVQQPASRRAPSGPYPVCVGDASDDTGPRSAARAGGMEDEAAAVTAATIAAAKQHGLFEELMQRAAEEAVREALGAYQTPGRPVPAAPPPKYTSWEDYLARTTATERRRWCAKKADKANSARLLSGKPETRLTADDVWRVLETAAGRCVHCGALAVEPRPTAPSGAPARWAQVGRRIGSLAHVRPRILGGANAAANLAWSCLWCNTWPEERVAGARDHGGIQPDDSAERRGPRP